MIETSNIWPFQTLSLSTSNLLPSFMSFPHQFISFVFIFYSSSWCPLHSHFSLLFLVEKYLEIPKMPMLESFTCNTFSRVFLLDVKPKHILMMWNQTHITPRWLQLQHYHYYYSLHKKETKKKKMKTLEGKKRKITPL